MHIDIAKEGSNKRNATPQMVAWQERVEKVAGFSHYLQMSGAERVEGRVEDEEILEQVPNFKPNICLANKPHHRSQKLTDIMQKHCCPGFLWDLKDFLNQKLLSHLRRAALQEVQIPFDSLDIFHGFKFGLEELGLDLDMAEREFDSIKAKPAKGTQRARFDTVVVMISPDCESTGVAGEYYGLISF